MSEIVGLKIGIIPFHCLYSDMAHGGSSQCGMLDIKSEANVKYFFHQNKQELLFF